MDKKQITDALCLAIGDQSDLKPDFIENLLERPRDRAMGDWAFPCFQLSRTLRKAPQQIASDLLDRLNAIIPSFKFIESVQATGPYLNFSVNTSAIAGEFIPTILDGSALATRPSKNKRVMIEYSQPNTHKAFHVGHMRNVALGDALVRIVEWDGNDVVAANYIGDVGAHIAKCLWYFKEFFKGDVPPQNRGEFLGEMYREATTLLDFTTLTKCPMPGLTTAEVKSIHAVEDKPNLKKVLVWTGKDQKTVLCGGKGYQEGDMVAYAPVGSKVKGRLVQEKETHGVLSQGMICSEKELGLSGNNDQIFNLDAHTEPGQEVAEALRMPEALDASQSVLEIMAERSSGVSSVLKALEAKEPEITKLWEETKTWSMDAFLEIYDWLGARFDHYFFESDVGDEGKNLVMEYLEKGVFIKSEGTVGADLTSEKLPFFMLLKSDGTGLYSTKDLSLAKRKFEDFKIDHSIYVVDASQSLHFQQVFAALRQMGFEQADDCYHLAYGLVVLKEGKMSSRGGTIILFSELRDLLNQKIRQDFLDKYKGEWPEEEIAQASRSISIATIRYGMLNCDQTKNIVFDLGEWSSKSGNTGPYLLYAYARIASMLRKSSSLVNDTEVQWDLLQSEEEKTLASLLTEFPGMVAKASTDHRPQLICMYLFSLARAFSRMYDRVSILKAETSALRSTRLKLAEATGMVLKKGLHLLGIQTLERM